MSKTQGASFSVAHRKFVAELSAQVARIVAESGNPNGFDSAAWVRQWISQPNPALGCCPVELFDDAEGRAKVVQLLASAQSGAFW
jgi:hypothetical protein